MSQTKGLEYQLHASISNCMVLIRQNEGAKIILHAKSPTFRAAKLKGFTVNDSTLTNTHFIRNVMHEAHSTMFKDFQELTLKYFQGLCFFSRTFQASSIF